MIPDGCLAIPLQVTKVMLAGVDLKFEPYYTADMRIYYYITYVR